MEKINKYKIQCPGAEDYRRFLQDKGDMDFNNAFEQHLNECELCREAIEGYRMNHAIPVEQAGNQFYINSNEKKNNRRYLYILGSVAAALVFTAGWWALQSLPVDESANIEDQLQSEKMVFNIRNSTGKLSKQLPEEYWYICNSDVFINDQEVEAEAINQAIDHLDASKSLIIEVGCTCDDNVNSLIEKIKSQKQVTIITYSKGGQIRPKQS